MEIREIREIEGKKFIEFEEDKRQKRKMIVSIVFLILMVVAIAALINTTLILVKNKDIIQNDPLIFGMKIHNFTTCECIDVIGKQWFSTETGFTYIGQGKNWINYSDEEHKFNFTNVEVINNGTSRSYFVFK